MFGYLIHKFINAFFEASSSGLKLSRLSRWGHLGGLEKLNSYGMVSVSSWVMIGLKAEQDWSCSSENTVLELWLDGSKYKNDHVE